MNVLNAFVFAEEKSHYGEEKRVHPCEEKHEWRMKAPARDRLRVPPGQNMSHRNTVTLNIACLGETGKRAKATVQRGARLDSISIALRKAFTRKALLHEQARGRGERISTVSL